MILYINTTQRDFLEFALIDKKSEVFFVKKEVLNKQTENMLSLLDKFLKTKKVKLSDLEKIVVKTGPGSFTSVRIGVVLANTLAMSLKIPVCDIYEDGFDIERDYLKIIDLKAKSEFVLPYYDREPNITISKK